MKTAHASQTRERITCVYVQHKKISAVLFMSFYWISSWMESHTGLSCVSVEINIPSGVESIFFYFVCVRIFARLGSENILT